MMRASAERLRTLWRAGMQDSLYRNSLYLLLNMGLTAAAGFVFWAVCARLYSASSVGFATALLGALGLATSLSNLGMSRTVLRFLGSSKTPARDLVSKLAVVAAGSVVSGVILSFLLGRFGVPHPTVLTSVLFIATVTLMSAKLLLDNVFVALQSAIGTLIENGLFNLVKIAAPALLVGFGFAGIFGAQLAAAFASVATALWLLRSKHQYRLRTRPSRAALQGKWAFAVGSYSSDIIGSLPANVLPIIVVSKLGAVSGALWYIAMLLVNLLLAISSSINQAMFAEMSNAAGSIWAYVKKATLAMYALVTPLAVGVAVFAPFILKLFGPQYAAAAPTLRLMSLFALLGVANYITGSILAYYKKLLYLTMVNITNAAIVMAYCLLWATNLNGIVTGWVWGEVANVVLFVGGALYVAKRQQGKTI